MIYDRRDWGISLDPEEAQLNEGGANQWDNCGAADYAWALKQLGNGDPFEPQQIMDKIHGVGYHGGELSSRLINFFAANRGSYPKLPPIVVHGAPDVVIANREAAAKRWLTTNWWWCNSNGDIQARNTGILHWSSVIYDTGSALGIFNIMRGQLVELSYASARAAYAGEFTTFEAAVGGGLNFVGEDAQRLKDLHNAIIGGKLGNPDGVSIRGWTENVTSALNHIADQLKGLPGAGGVLTSAQAQQIKEARDVAVQIRDGLKRL